VCVSLLTVGCGEKLSPIIDESYIDSLSDTVYAEGFSRQVLLSDGVGGYYFDDALRQVKHGEYGLFRFGDRIVADWELSSDQRRMDVDPLFCIVHPEWIERQYKSGLKVRIELPPYIHGLLFTISNPTKKTISFRPIFDQQSVSGLHYLTDTPDYRSNWIYSSSRLEVRFTNERSYSVSCPENSKFVEIDEVIETVYERGQSTGDIEFANLYFPGEIKIKGEKSFQFALSTGAVLADSILTSQEDWRDQRRKHSIRQLDKFAFTCQYKAVEHAFAWSRMTLAKLLTVYNDNHTMYAGLPHSPYGSGWHTALSAKGLFRSQSDPDRAYQLLTELLKPANEEGQNPLTKGYFATEIFPDGRNAKYSGTGGLSVLALKDLQNYFNSVDTLYRNALTERLGEYLKTASDRYEMGFEINDSDYLGNVRQGATIESQFLSAIAREFVGDSKIAGQFPQGFFNGINTSMFQPDESVYPPTISGQTGQYRLPLSLSAVKRRYKTLYDQRLDRVLLFSEGYSRKDRIDEKIRPELIDDSTQTVSHILALGWHQNDNVKLNRELLGNAAEVGLIGDAGFRSLASSDPHYQSTHEFYLPDRPQGVLSRGDLLVWTAGRLADMYRSVGQLDSLQHLVDRLSHRVLESGLIGGLPEVENGDPMPTGNNIVRNPVHSTSTAEYIRVMMDNIIGLEWRRSAEVRIEPMIPNRWGAVTIEAGDSDSRIIITKQSNRSWSVSQHGRKPYLTITMVLHPTLESRVFTSARIRPGETTHFNLTESNGVWKAKAVSE